MHVLVIYAHPNHQSLNYAFLQQVIDGCKENSSVSEVKVLDLYSLEFNPVLVFNENKKRRNMHKEPYMEAYREHIRWADKIVFVYPIWWGRPPAMLLGFFDQLFAQNFAYRYNNNIFPEGLLKGKSVVCVSTMQGPTIYAKLWLHNVHKVLMKKAVFNFIGIKQIKFFEFANMESPKGKHEKKLNQVFHYFRTVAT